MKKQTKKLTLAKETVGSLSATDLKEVAGGTVISCQTCYTCPRERPVPSVNVCTD